MSDIDSFLHRNILPGKEFDKLIPKSTCRKINYGIGNTDHSIEKMADIVLQDSWQMEKVARKLEHASLRQTTDNIFWFLYNHFQYKADKKPQFLRSPGCSWSERFDGIDCKSYSILASCILTEMDLFHYIRRIKQPSYMPKEFTHVYVIVPLNQNSGKLDAGYYVIDGTVKGNIEPRFIIADDEFMEGLPHFYLQAPRGLGDPDTTGATTTGTTGSVWNAAGNAAVSYGEGYVKDNSKNWLKKISLKTVGKWFSFRCLGGEALDNAGATREVESIGNYVALVIGEMNDALRTNDMVLFNKKYNEYHGLTGVLVLSVVKKLSEGWNGCTRENMVEVAKATRFYFDGAMQMSLETWAKQYFNMSAGPKVPYTAQMTLSKSIMPFCSYTLPLQGWSPTSTVLTRKPEFENVPDFLPTAYTFQLLNTPSAFNPQSYLDTLQQAINIITNPGTLITGQPSTLPQNIPGTNIPTGSVVNISDSGKPTTAGIGVLGYVMVAGGLWWLGMEMFKTNKPAKKQPAN